MDGSDEQRSFKTAGGFPLLYCPIKEGGVARQQFLYRIAVKVTMILQSLVLLETSFATFEKLFNPYLDKVQFLFLLISLVVENLVS